MQFINLFYCLLIFSLPITGMDRKRSGGQTEPKPLKTYRTDPEVTAELRVLQNIYAWNRFLREITPSKVNTHGQ